MRQRNREPERTRFAAWLHEYRPLLIVLAATLVITSPGWIHDILQTSFVQRYTDRPLWEAVQREKALYYKLYSIALEEAGKRIHGAWFFPAVSESPMIRNNGSVSIGFRAKEAYGRDLYVTATFVLPEGATDYVLTGMTIEDPTLLESQMSLRVNDAGFEVSRRGRHFAFSRSAGSEYRRVGEQWDS